MAQGKDRSQSSEEVVQLSMSVETTQSECYGELEGKLWEVQGLNEQGEEVGNCYHPGDTTMGKSKN